MNAKLTDTGVIDQLRTNHGIYATTAADNEPSNPNQNTATIAVQQATHQMDDDVREFLQDQGFERCESLGRGLFVWMRDE
jgi:hypothetical protein